MIFCKYFAVHTIWTSNVCAAISHVLRSNALCIAENRICILLPCCTRCLLHSSCLLCIEWCIVKKSATLFERDEIFQNSISFIVTRHISWVTTCLRQRGNEIIYHGSCAGSTNSFLKLLARRRVATLQCIGERSFGGCKIIWIAIIICVTSCQMIDHCLNLHTCVGGQLYSRSLDSNIFYD